MNQHRISTIDAVVLCGGLGTRLSRVLPGRQKVVANVKKRPFLGIILERIFSQGVGRAVLCVGHLKEQVVECVEQEKLKHPEWGEIIFSEEDTPLGTGGAVKNAEAKIRGDQFFVMNGDTLAKVPLGELRDFHVAKNSITTIAVASVPNRIDVGSIDIRPDGRILGFHERAAERTGLVNAGTYLMQRAVFRYMPEGTFSLEQDFFPKLIKEHPCFAFVAPIDVLDIGTPERYERANELFEA